MASDSADPSGTSPDLTYELRPILSGTGLQIELRESILGGLYTIAGARPVGKAARPRRTSPHGAPVEVSQ